MPKKPGKKKLNVNELIGQVINGKKILAVEQKYGCYLCDVEDETGKVLKGLKLKDIKEGNKIARLSSIKIEQINGGYVLELRNKNKYLVSSKKDLINLETGEFITNLINFSPRLTFSGFSNYDVMSIYSNIGCSELIWKRKNIVLTPNEKKYLESAHFLGFKYITKNDGGLVYFTKEKPYSKGAREYIFKNPRLQYVILDISCFRFIKYDIATEEDNFFYIPDLLEEGVEE